LISAFHFNMNTKFAVASHILTYLAFGNGSAASSERIAEHLHTNPVVVRRLVSLLREAGLVTTKMGAGGGALLSRCPTTITLRDVYDAIEGEEADLFALTSAQKSGCGKMMASVQTALENACNAAEETMKRTIASVSIADIVDASIKALSRKR
jgi:Rrf2 family protein